MNKIYVAKINPGTYLVRDKYLKNLIAISSNSAAVEQQPDGTYKPIPEDKNAPFLSGFQIESVDLGPLDNEGGSPRSMGDLAAAMAAALNKAARNGAESKGEPAPDGVFGVHIEKID